MSDLMGDVLPRLVLTPTRTGIDIYQAANSIQNMIFKHLVDFDSDLIATGNLFQVLQGYDYMFSLPSDFLSMSERPLAVDVSTLWNDLSPWMAGTVVSYDSVLQTLVVSVTSANGSGALSAWYVSLGVLPGMPVQQIDTSVSAITVPTTFPSNITLTTVTSDNIVAGMNIIISSQQLPTDTSICSRMDQEFLDSDNENDDYWWLNFFQNYTDFGGYGDTKLMPRWFKIIGTQMYVRPKPTIPLMITGKYKQSPTDLANPTDIIPYQFFYETFKEGVIKVITKGLSSPQTDAEVKELIATDVDTVLWSKVKPLPNRRIKRTAWL